MRGEASSRPEGNEPERDKVEEKEEDQEREGEGEPAVEGKFEFPEATGEVAEVKRPRVVSEVEEAEKRQRSRSGSEPVASDEDDDSGPPPAKKAREIMVSWAEFAAQELCKVVTDDCAEISTFKKTQFRGQVSG